MNNSLRYRTGMVRLAGEGSFSLRDHIGAAIYPDPSTREEILA